MNPRADIIRALQEAGLISDFVDYCNVSSALEQGRDRDSILYDMPEVERWPGVFEFLRQRL